MYESAGGGGTGAAEVVVDPEAIHEVATLLAESVDQVRGQEVHSVPASAFGASAAAAELGRHTELAREAVLAALRDVSTGLEICRENVDAYRRDMTATDDAAAADVRPLEVALRCVSQPISQSVSQPNACAPGGGGA